ncbi:hemolysin family protein [Fredinandcohnia sp. QZ13]|uniref:hemolysin family protein n=1 Tax=Fredinandcohnia sp. QZ13 TaxID=3073144 RepID=UPI0028534343|nr:hemolysin family protein [Fredinandcohnia sp. QZ13]MDR4886159.1 hemolysin family protein [Fredinandcohnia sp. QZ13]
MVVEILILVVLILLNSFFAASEMAMVSLNDNKVKLMADSGDKKAILLHRLLSNPSGFLATIQIGITLAGFLASAFAAGSFATYLTNWLVDIGVPVAPSIIDSLSVIVITLILSYFTLVIGELVPKRLALQKAEEISLIAARPLTILSKVTSPFVKLLTLSTNGLVRLFGVDPNADDENVTEEEIRMMVDVGKERGTIQESEKFMINNIFEFDNKTVSDIMTHRTNIIAIPLDYTLKEIIHLVTVEKYTRFPVYDESIDQIVGILHSKELIKFVDDCDDTAFNLKDLLRDPYFVLESKHTNELFKEMQKNNIHMAIVIDEYGGTDGIVTIEDLIEEIVGNIFDEYDEYTIEDEEYIQLDENTYSMAGTINLYEVEGLLKIDFPTDEYDTLSGFVIGQLGYIPSGDVHPQIDYKNHTFKVIEMDEKRIMRIKVMKNAAPSEIEEEKE